MNPNGQAHRIVRTLFYAVKPLIPRTAQLFLRRALMNRRRQACAQIWPIDPQAGDAPPQWKGWPDGKKFALVLTHDVDTQAGHDKCRRLMQAEEERGFRSSFTIVPERYNISPELLKEMTARGFEVAVHGLKHDGKLFSSREVFLQKAACINRYLKAWGAVGFRAPAMHHNLDWILDLDIEYDMSTFDVDPFEPQPDGMGTIFPFWVDGTARGRKGYVELPYTLSQDFTPYILFRDKDNGCWKRKLDWIVEKGGMALINVHPDYMGFDPLRLGREEYPAAFYTDWLDYIKSRYANQYWAVLPRDMARFIRSETPRAQEKFIKPFATEEKPACSLT
ncbi:MAG: hypothetical protein A2X46_15835 [Lentisphaerae bacterium GWF2_57_35]|nr:MAG: hypothetical protein A2X46_15835 [Lentisphaerae bacterium GWF2_57_35]